MTKQQFKEACERVKSGELQVPINSNEETLVESFDSFSRFESTEGSIKAIHTAGRKIP